MSLIAAHCAKTLVIASTAGNPALQRATKLLLPGMIECVATIAATDDEGSYERRSQVVGEIWKAFAALFTSTAEELRKASHLITLSLSFLIYCFQVLDC